MSPGSQKGSGLLDRIERLGNALPDPMTLFLLGSVLVFAASAVATSVGWESRLYDQDGELVLEESARNLLTADGFRWLITNLVQIFVGFRPLGLVLVAVIGIAVADRSGLLAAVLKGVLLMVPRALLTPATFFTGVMSSMAVDAGYIVLPPLAAAVFRAAGRSPLLGLAVVVAGVASGFNANLFITGLDPMLAGLTEETARILDPTYSVNPACNLYFMIASTLVLTGVGWAITAFFVEPRLSRRSPEDGGVGAPAGEDEEQAPTALTAAEFRGILWAVGATVVTLIGILACIFFEWGFLHDPAGSIGTGPGQQPFATWIVAIVPLLLLLFLVPGLAYGLAAGTIRSDRDVVRMMSEYMGLMGNYIVLAFFAAIFVESFDHSNLGRMLAIEGGNALRQVNLPSWALMVGFILVVATINMFVGSMSAKWAMLATVFVPMFMTVGVSPELTQLTYRIGDSVTNSISPLNPYVVVVLVFMQQHVKKAGLGTLVSLMLPYALVFLIVWSAMLVFWIVLGLPIGPGAPLAYPG